MSGYQNAYFFLIVQAVVSSCNIFITESGLPDGCYNRFDIMQKDKAEVSVEALKEVVKRLKAVGAEELTHHELAIAVTTVGFREVSKEFGGEWGERQEKIALAKLQKSDYSLPWLGKSVNSNLQPFLQLCLRGDIEKIKQFIFTIGKTSKKDLYSLTDNCKRSSLHIAVRQGFDVLAEYLIGEGFPVNIRDRQLKTPLHYCKNELICQLLLKKGASPLARDNKYCTPVHLAAAGSEFKVLEMLLKKANVANERDCTGKTPLHYAVYNNTEEQISIMRTLVQNGAQVNEKDNQGRTPLHYSAQMGKTRCIPYLLQKKANPDIPDSHQKTPFDLGSEKVKKIISAYWTGKGVVTQNQQKEKRSQLKKISNSSIKQPSKEGTKQSKQALGQVYSREVNQVATWVRQKFFVLMKKLQESGIKALWHLKRPYIYTGSWAEDVQSLQQLYESFLGVSGPEAAMRAFNILCPYEKPLPNVLGKSQEAFQSFFGENWFSNDPIQKTRNLHSQTKIRGELESKIKEIEDLQVQLSGYRGQIERLEGRVRTLEGQIKHYERVQEDLRKQRTKNTQQYTQSLRLLGEISALKSQMLSLAGGSEKGEVLTNLVQDLRSKNEDLLREIQSLKVRQAAERRKCGAIFLKSLSLARSGEAPIEGQSQNLFDDDAIINLYQLLRQNPPNLEKRFKLSDRRGTGKLNVEEFTKLLENLNMLPQDVMSMHRICGFAHGKKTLSLDQFKTILENRHKNRPMWEKKLIRKLKTIILGQNMTLDKLFELIDADNSGTIEASELRKGLESFNIFMNQTDWSNLFNLLDADKSGTVELEELKNLFQLETSGKLDSLASEIKKQQGPAQQDEKDEAEEQNKQEEEENKQEEEENKEEEQQKQDGKEEKQQQQPEGEPQAEPQKSQRSDNKLLSQQQRSQYQQQDSQLEGGITKLNGEIKVQVPRISVPEDYPTKFYIKFVINEQDTIKHINLELPKLTVVVKFEMTEYKILSTADLFLAMHLSKTRDFDEENYLGEARVGLQPIFEQPEKWAVNGPFEVQTSEYQKEGISGSLVVQVKWTPHEQS